MGHSATLSIGNASLMGHSETLNELLTAVDLDNDFDIACVSGDSDGRARSI